MANPNKDKFYRADIVTEKMNAKNVNALFAILLQPLPGQKSRTITTRIVNPYYLLSAERATRSSMVRKFPLKRVMCFLFFQG